MLMLCVVVGRGKEKSNLSLNESINLTLGLILGVCNENDLNATSQCIMNSTESIELIANTVKDLKDDDDNSISDSIKQIGVMVDNLAETLKTCETMKGSDLVKLKEIGLMFAKPLSLILEIPLNLVVNFKEIKEFIKTGKGHFKNNEFHLAGFNYGSAAAIGALNPDGTPTNILKSD